MKIILSILFLAALLNISEGSSSIHLTATKNEQGVIQSYYTTTWTGPNQAPVYTRYTIAEAQSKFIGLLTKAQSGTSANPERLILNFNDDGDLISVEFQVIGAQFERVILKGESIPSAAKTDAGTAKSDVETKIGKDIGGGAIKPPKS